MPIIKRYLSDEFLDAFIRDFSKLIKMVKDLQGELDLAIRENYLNVYFKGNSISNISLREPGCYTVKIHKKFFEGTSADNPDYFEEKKMSGDNVIVTLSSQKNVRQFLQKKHLEQFSRRVKKVNYSEELEFEQELITDNRERGDLIIIDRQVTDNQSIGKLDLLALEQIEADSNKYRFLVIEVKLGNNPELKKDVAQQLDTYVAHIKKHIGDYQDCYQRQYLQKKRLGLFDESFFDEISISDEVRGLVVVGGYTGIAAQSIKELKEHSPNIEVKLFKNKL